MTEINWRAYYQKEAEIIDFNPETDGVEIHRCLACWSVFPSKKVESLLDVGCGDGFFCHWIKGKAKIPKVVGVDISEPRLARAQTRYPEIIFKEGEIAQLPFATNEFDVVSCIEVLEHQLNPLLALKELARISNKFVIVTVPDRQVIRYTLCPHCLKTYPVDGHLHSFNNQKIMEMAEKANLRVEKTKIYYIPVGAASIPFWIGSSIRKIQKLLKPGPGTFLAVRMRKI